MHRVDGDGAKCSICRTRRWPAYMIVNRKNQRIHVLTDPFANEYQNHRVYAPGESFTLPSSVGAEVELSVDHILAAARR
ncbi:Uma2 family endonuclease [Streptomyces sp. H10-C2]|uniref:Uma2 family endonuclease n=1 Tax=unclassified Streptomyces TaxID=2593676 RepID=UPI0024BA9712|nr:MULTISPECIES: Uma2 family endonuclease [unclassified Streptomyces]MDJ0342727.1 Uma2 family endonuclease [Streptomyces sp. PH10-H1]MDJ0372563.1 Uma2 family endonuclease [Streptomyces sp. H10-C2]